MNFDMNFLPKREHHVADDSSAHVLVELCPQQIVHKLGLLPLVSRAHRLVLEDEV